LAEIKPLFLFHLFQPCGHDPPGPLVVTLLVSVLFGVEEASVASSAFVVAAGSRVSPPGVVDAAPSPLYSTVVTRVPRSTPNVVRLALFRWKLEPAI